MLILLTVSINKFNPGLSLVGMEACFSLNDIEVKICFIIIYQSTFYLKS